jgi:hypothetical protein
MKLFKAALLVMIVQIFMAHSLTAQVVSRISKADLYKTAASELLEILEKMPEGKESGYGFNDRFEFNRAELGIPYQEYKLPYKNHSTAQTEPTGYWRIPVTVDGENRAMLRYIREDGKWQWKGFGAAGLARELEGLEKKQSTKPLSGKIIRDTKLVCDYIQFNIKSEKEVAGNLIPLETAKSFLKAVDSKVKPHYSVSEIMKLRLDRIPAEIQHSK